MFAGIVWLDLHLLGEPNSLKAKRMVIRSLKDRLINRFQFSVAEVGSNDLWQRSELGVSMISSKQPEVDKKIDKLIRFIDKENNIEIIDIYKEIIKVK